MIGVMRKIRAAVVTMVAGLALVAPIALPALQGASVSAATDAKQQICQGIGGTQSGEDCTVADQPSVNDTLKKVINLFSAIAGITAVIMIIIAGFRFVTGNGDSNTIGSARRTVLYAVVGIVVVLLSQAIVHFVLQRLG